MDTRNWRQLPDGTWMNKRTGTVSAPLQQSPRPSATAGATKAAFLKQRPSPPAGNPTEPPLVPAPANPNLTDLGGYGALPGEWGMHMRQGRNYPALGQEAGLSGTRKLVAIAAIIGVAGLTVWLQNRGKKAK